MKPSFKICLGILAACGMASVADAQPTFELGFDAPARVCGQPGGSVSIEAVGSMTPGGDLADSGAQGWSLSFRATGWSIAEIGVAGTVSDDSTAGGLVNTGFRVIEVATSARAGSACEGAGANEAGVQAIVLSFVMPIQLPQDRAVDIVRVSLEGTAPDVGETRSCSIAFVDGCRGSGQPVDNRVTHMGNTVVPSLGSATTEVCAVDERPCPGAAEVGVLLSGSASGVEAEAAASFITPIEKYTADVESRAGETGSATVYATISSNGLASGVQGWSLAGSVSGDGNLVSATTMGTVAAEVANGGKRNTGFDATNLVVPEMNSPAGSPQGQGVVSAVVLSFVMPITLNPTGSASVLCLEITAAAPQSEDAQTVNIDWLNGLQGPGQPVNNVATVAGNTVQFCGCQSGCVNFVLRTAEEFLRCDPNSDGQNDIADAVWIVNELFRGGSPSTCPDSADCDDSGLVDLTDALYTVAYQFQGGPAPVSPFPACGEDTTDDDLGPCDGAVCP